MELLINVFLSERLAVSTSKVVIKIGVPFLMVLRFYKYETLKAIIHKNISIFEISYVFKYFRGLQSVSIIIYMVPSAL